MMTSEPVAELHPDYSSAGATATPWREVVGLLERAEIFWISTVRADGRPHVAPLPAMWLEGALHFTTGLDEQKGRNLLGNPNCILTTGNNSYRQGLDVVVEGRAVRVTDRPTLERLAELWQSKIGWPWDIVEGGFRPRPEGPQPENADTEAVVPVFAIKPSKICPSDAASALLRHATDSDWRRGAPHDARERRSSIPRVRVRQRIHVLTLLFPSQ